MLAGKIKCIKKYHDEEQSSFCPNFHGTPLFLAAVVTALGTCGRSCWPSSLHLLKKMKTWKRY